MSAPCPQSRRSWRRWDSGLGRRGSPRTRRRTWSPRTTRRWRRTTTPRSAGRTEGPAPLQPEVLRRDLQQLGRIGQAVYLVQHDPPRTHVAQEALRGLQRAADARQFAIEVLDVRQRPTQDRLAGAADPGQPDDRLLAPQLLYGRDPVASPYHVQAWMSHGGAICQSWWRSVAAAPSSRPRRNRGWCVWLN